MPIYRYRHPTNGSEIEVYQKMLDKHEYLDEKGVKYERIFESLNVCRDTSVNPFSANDFINKTKDKNMNIGDMWSLSKELGEKRKHSEGVDKINKKHKKNTG
jgi:predicted nucleic acid-binding Zn ribbon protein